jgi:hypothetical protein
MVCNSLFINEVVVHLARKQGVGVRAARRLGIRESMAVILNVVRESGRSEESPTDRADTFLLSNF